MSSQEPCDDLGSCLVPAVLGIGNLTSKTTAGEMDLGRDWTLWDGAGRLKLRTRLPHFNGGPPRGDGWTRRSPCLYANVRENQTLRVDLMKWRPGTPLLMAGAGQERRASGKSWAGFRSNTVGTR